MDLKGYVSLAYAIIDMSINDVRKKEDVTKHNRKYIVSDFDYSTAKNFPTTQLYDVCKTLIEEWHRTYDCPKYHFAGATQK